MGIRVMIQKMKRRGKIISEEIWALMTDGSLKVLRH